MSRSILALALTLAAALAGCFGEVDAPVEGAATNGTAPLANSTVPVALDPIMLEVATAGNWPVNPAFSPATLEAASGAEVTVQFENADAVLVAPHNWVLDGVDGAGTEAVRFMGTTSVTFVAPAPGEYEYYCSVGDHRDRGMVGTLTVA